MWDKAQLAVAAKYLNGNTVRQWNAERAFTAEDVASALARSNIAPTTVTKTVTVTVPDTATAAELATAKVLLAATQDELEALKAKFAKLEAAISAAGLTIQQAEHE